MVLSRRIYFHLFTSESRKKGVVCIHVGQPCEFGRRWKLLQVGFKEGLGCQEVAKARFFEEKLSDLHVSIDRPISLEKKATCMS